MKSIKPIIYLSVYFFSQLSLSQIYFHSDYLGFIKTESGIIINYNIFFSCNNYECDGYSISDLNGENETKSIIKGYVNTSEGFIDLFESEIVYTKADYSTFDEFCYLNFRIPTKSYFKEKTKKLKTNYTGYFLDKEICSNGELELILSENLQKQIEKIKEKVLNKRKVKKFLGDSLSIVINKKLDSLEKKIIEKKENAFFTKKIEKKNLTSIYLQDIGIQDKDRIMIQTKNESTVIELTKKLRLLDIENNSVINIIGISEGSVPTIPIKLILKFKNKSFEQSIILRKKDTFRLNIVD